MEIKSSVASIFIPCRKIPFLILLLFAAGHAFTQKSFRRIYRGTTIMILADSLKHTMLEGFLDEGLPPEVASQKGYQMARKLYQAKDRIVNATADSIIIEFDRATVEGRLNIEGGDNPVLYKNDEIYFSAGEGFAHTAISAPKKNFVSTGRKRAILNYTCTEYASTHSAAVVWVTDKLPAYINTGTRTGGINGAVLAYEHSYELMKIKGVGAKIE